MKLDYEKCKHCKYFIQHYGIDVNSIYKIFCGHCTKRPNPDSFAVYSGRQPCPHFEQNKGQQTRLKRRKIVDLLTELNVNIETIKLFLNKHSASQPISELMLEKLNK